MTIRSIGMSIACVAHWYDTCMEDAGLAIAKVTESFPVGKRFITHERSELCWYVKSYRPSFIPRADGRIVWVPSNRHIR